MNREIEKHKLAAEIRKEILHVSPEQQGNTDTTREDLMSETILKNIHTDVELTTIKVSEGGTEQKSYTEAYMVAGMVFQHPDLHVYFPVRSPGDAGSYRGENEPYCRSHSIVGEALPVNDGQDHRRGYGGTDTIPALDPVYRHNYRSCSASISRQVQIAGTKSSHKRNQIKMNPQQNDNSTVVKAGNNNDNTNVVLDALSSINFPELLSAFIFYFYRRVPSLWSAVCCNRIGC